LDLFIVVNVGDRLEPVVSHLSNSKSPMAEHPLWGSISFRFLFPTITTIKSKVYPFLFKGAEYCVNPSQLVRDKCL